MPDIKGDATQDEIDEQIKQELSASLGSATDTNPVRLTPAAAARILELLGPPKSQQKAQAQSAKAEEEDEDDDEPTPAAKRKR